MISRLWIYLWETFKIPSRILLTVINVAVVQLFILKEFNPYLFGTGSAVLFFSLLYYRICDEFKDEDTDKVFFPERPLPSGRVKKNDLKVLLVVAGVILLATPFLAMESLGFGVAVLIDCLLMQFYFFLPKLMEQNRLVAFATHAPYAFVINFYLIALHCRAYDIDIISFENLGLILVLSLPGFHWEVIRKTFVRERPGYQTYSSILGYQGAILLSLVFFFPLVIGLRIVLTDTYFIPLVFVMIAYCMHIWGLGLKESEGLISLRTKSEFLSSVVILTLLAQGYYLL